MDKCEVRKAFIRCVQVYNVHPIADIRRDFTSIHKRYSAGDTPFIIWAATMREHYAIRDYFQPKKVIREYPEFHEAFTAYMTTLTKCQRDTIVSCIP